MKIYAVNRQQGIDLCNGKLRAKQGGDMAMLSIVTGETHDTKPAVSGPVKDLLEVPLVVSFSKTSMTDALAKEIAVFVQDNVRKGRNIVVQSSQELTHYGDDSLTALACALADYFDKHLCIFTLDEDGNDIRINLQGACGGYGQCRTHGILTEQLKNTVPEEDDEPDQPPMTIPVPGGGRLEVKPSTDTEYPGIFVTHVLPDGKEAAAVLMEYSPMDRCIMLRAWSADDPEGDPVLTQSLSDIIKPDAE